MGFGGKRGSGSGGRGGGGSTEKAHHTFLPGLMAPFTFSIFFS